MTEVGSGGLDAVLRPGRVAVVGASRDRDTVGGLLFHNLIAGGFDGTVYPVNPSADSVQGVVAYPTLGDCPGVCDLAFVAVPARGVPDVVREAGELGVSAVCVISAGFAETGERGAEAQRRTVAIARENGTRLVGPNCMGVLVGDPTVRMNGTFSRDFPPPGRVAFASQSGGTGLSVLADATRRRLGFSSFVSLGNAADVTAGDLLEYWETDDSTEIVLLYLESFGDPRRFARIARRMGRHKPVVVVKSGRTTAGERAASSHTASLSAGETAVRSLFLQSGAIRVDTLEEMFDVTRVLDRGSVPDGPGVAIVTNGGGPGILAADACAANGLEVVELTDRTRSALADALPPDASIVNPVDLLAGADADDYRGAVRTVAADRNVDAVIAIFIPPVLTPSESVVAALSEVAAEIDTGFVAVMMSDPGSRRDLEARGVCAFAYPEEAARALGRVARWATWRDAPRGEVVRPPGLRPADAAQVVDEARGRSDERGGTDDGLWLSLDESRRLLDAYGIDLVASRVVTSADEARDAFGTLTAPLVVKVDAPIHKSDVGGVVLDVDTPDDAADAVTSIRESLRAAGLEDATGRYVLQPMLTDGVEIAVGVNVEPEFGPLLMVGLGGEYLELVDDVAVRLVPVTDLEVEEMLSSLAAYELLTGYRGRPSTDVGALRELVHRVAALADDVEQLTELDLNPVMVHRDGVDVVDVRIRLR